MKILFIISTLRIGGAERVCAVMASKFSEAFDVTLLKFDTIKPFYELSSEVNVINLGLGVDNLGLIGNFKKRFVKIIEIRKIIKSGKFDCVISFLDSTNILVLASTFGLKTPIIVSEHTSFGARRSDIKYEILKRIFYPFASGLSVLSSYDKKHYQGFCKNISVIHNPNSFEDVDLNGVIKQDIVLFVGRLIELKNCEMFVKVAKNLKYSGYRFVVAGDGNLRNKLEILSKNLDANVEFLGNVSNMHDLYLKTKILISSSKVEGLGNALIEAIVFDCARVATKTIGAMELINDGVDGFLCEIDDENEMSLLVKKLIDDDGLRFKICQNARAKLGEFSVDSIYKKWLKLLEKSGVAVKKDMG
jgi:general glycosylation pathway protein